MPPMISPPPPPPPGGRLAAASSAQLAYTPTSDDRLDPIRWVLYILLMVSLTIIPFLLSVILLFRHDVHPTSSLPSEDTQSASPPLSDETVDSGPIDTAIGLTCLVILIIIIIFLFFLNVVVMVYRPVPPEHRRRRRVAPIPAPHGRPLHMEPPRVEVKAEASPPDGRDQWDKIESGSSFNDRNPTQGSGGIGEFPPSHSTGDLLTPRPGEDVELFTLRLLIDRLGPVLPLESCSRGGY